MPRKYTPAQPPKPKPPKRGEIGDSMGLSDGGVIQSDDYNKNLTGTGRIKIFDKMRLGDATVRAMLQIIKLPIRAANWRIDPASDARSDKKIAEFIEGELFDNGTRTWDEILNNALIYLDYGSMPFEIVYEFRQIEEQVMIGLRKLAARKPDTIQSWKLKNGKTGISQYTVNGLFEIPIEKCIVFINDREGENWEGISLLRYAYKHWFIKDKLYLIDAMAFERQGLGIPFGKMPVGATDADKDKMDEVLENMRANEKGFARYPTDWEVGFMDMKAGTARNPKQMVDHHDRQIPKSVLAQFIELGANGGGSYALQKDQGAIFIMALEAIAKTVRDTTQKYLVEKLVDYNYDVEDYPKLGYDAIGQKDLNVFTTALQRVIQTEVIKPDDTIEKYTRDMMDLPESDGELADPVMIEESLSELEMEMDNLEMALNDEEPEEMEEPPPEEIEAAHRAYRRLTPPKFTELYGAEVFEIVKAARGPISEETRKKISEALKRYWDRKGRKGKKKGKGRKARNPELTKKRKEVKALRKQLRDFTDKVRREYLEMKVKGEKLNEQEKAKRELSIFDEKKKFRDKIDALRFEIDDIRDKETAAKETKEEKEATEPTPDALLKMSDDVGKAVKALENAK